MIAAGDVAQEAPPAPQDVEFALDVPVAHRRLAETAIADLCRQPSQGTRWRVDALHGGASNVNYLVTTPEERFVLTAAGQHGRRLGSDRESGNAIHRAAAEVGLAPPIIAQSRAGHTLTVYIPGRALTPQDFRGNVERLLETGAMLARLHNLPPLGRRHSIFEVVSDLTAIARSEGLELPDDYSQLEAAVHDAEQVLAGADAPDGVCHNDLVCQNFVLDSGRMWLVDWEFGWIGDRYFDLGGLAVNAGLEPGDERELLRGYFGHEPSGEHHRARMYLMQVVSAVREAVWSVVAAPVLDNDWDYAAWADKYFDRALQQLEGDRWDLALRVARDGRWA